MLNLLESLVARGFVVCTGFLSFRNSNDLCFLSITSTVSPYLRSLQLFQFKLDSYDLTTSNWFIQIHMELSSTLHIG